MPKDTKSLGNNKAPACESRSFVRKRKKVCILTHLRYFWGYTPNKVFNRIKRFFHYNEKSLLIPRKKKMLVENTGLFVLLLLFAFFIHTG